MRPVAALLAVAALSLTGCAERDGRATSSSWERLPAPPLSLRSQPLTVTIGHEVVVVGGDTGDPCPPNADCASGPALARDGAAYDVTTRRWTPVADAPVGITGSGGAVVGDRAYVVAGDRLLAYDRSDDAWTWVPTPPGPRDLSGVRLSVDGRRLVLTWGSDEQGTGPDRVLDTRTDRWTTLPDDPLGRSWDRSITATPHGLVLTAHRLVRGPDPEDPAIVHAAVLDRGRWRALPDSDQLGGGGWIWTGSELADPTLGGADGGEVNGYGRTIPDGGRLDPVTGTWSRLPHAPSVDPATGAGDGWPVRADGPRLVARGGFVVDPDEWTWEELGPPEDGPDSPGTATWVGDTLVVVGGERREPDAWTAEAAFVRGAWAWAPEG